MITATMPVQRRRLETGTSTRQQNTTARPARVASRPGSRGHCRWPYGPAAVAERSARGVAGGARPRLAIHSARVRARRVRIRVLWPIDGGHCSHPSADMKVGTTRTMNVVPTSGRQRPPLATVMRIFFVARSSAVSARERRRRCRTARMGFERRPSAAVDAVASVLMDRLLGVVSILSWRSPARCSRGDLIDIARCPSIRVVARALRRRVAVVFRPRAAAAAARLLAMLPRGDERIRLVIAIQRTHAFTCPWATCCYAPLASKSCACLQTYYRGLRTGTGFVPLGVYFALVPIVLVIVLMPITIYGIGTPRRLSCGVRARGRRQRAGFALSVLFLGLQLSEICRGSCRT